MSTRNGNQTKKPTRHELARALGIVDDYVRRLEKLGMPTDSAEAARQWRAANIQRAAVRDRSDQRQSADRKGRIG